ncbi:hypothetical protein [Rhizobium arsenicireducens]
MTEQTNTAALATLTTELGRLGQIAETEGADMLVYLIALAEQEARDELAKREAKGSQGEVRRRG